MDEINKILSSPVWWFSAIFVSILINLVSHYLAKGIDGLLSKLSSQWAMRSKQRFSSWNARVQVLKGNRNEQLIVASEESRHRLTAIYFLVFAALLQLLGVGTLAMFVMWTAVYEHIKASEIKWILREARKKS